MADYPPLESHKSYSDDIQELRKELRDLKNALRKEPNLSIGDWGGADGFTEKQMAKRQTRGRPFAPVARFTMTKGDINQISLRGSVWTAVLLAPLLLPLEVKFLEKGSRVVDEETGRLVKEGHFKETKDKKSGKMVKDEKKVMNGYIGRCYYEVPTFVALCLTATIQIVFAYHMHKMVPDLSEDDFGGDASCKDKADPLLRFVAVCVFLAYGLGSEVTEALVCNRWLSAFPSWNYQVHPGVIDRVIQRDGLAGLSFLLFEEATNDRGQSCLVPAVGLSAAFKWTCRVFLVFGRIMIASMIMIEAAGLILYSPTNRVVLESAVAATFVLDIDNYVYYFLVTDVVKERMAAVPPIGVSQGIGQTKTDWVWQGYGSYFMFVVLLGAATALFCGWCLPGEHVKYIAGVVFSFPLLIFIVWGSLGTRFNWNPKKKFEAPKPKEYREEYKITDVDFSFAQDSGRLEAARASSAPVDASLYRDEQRV